MGDIRVLIVDDSAMYRRLLRNVISQIPDVEVIGEADDGRQAIVKTGILRPDLLTLDVEMPVMDGLETLRGLKEKGIEVPVLMCSSLTNNGAESTVQALQLGAFEILSKPNHDSLDQNKEDLMRQLRPIFAALKTRKRLQEAKRIISNRAQGLAQTPTTNAQKPPAPKVPSGRVSSFAPTAKRIEIVGIGISTGGPNALSEMLPKLPGNLRVPIVVVQHMPPVFVKALTESLDQKSKLRVVEGQAGMILEPGTIYFAPGDKQMRIRRITSRRAMIDLTDDPPENHCRPAADYLFRSLADAYGGNVLGVIMTGMGRDGTSGLKVLKSHGATVIGQDRESSVVYGMPMEAAKAGVVDIVAPLDRIADEIVRCVN